MAVLDEAAIRELAAIKGERAPITTCYLDVDGRRQRRYPDLEQEVDRLLRDARAKADGEPSVQMDLGKIEQFVRDGIDRSTTRGIAIVACSEHDVWEVIELPVPVTPQVAINAVPAVGQLEAVIQQDEPLGILTVDRQVARMFVVSLGQILHRFEIFDALPRDESGRGEKDRGGDHPEHVESAVQQHLRNAAGTAFAAWQEHGFAHFVIAAREPLARDLIGRLHPYLLERLVEQVEMPAAPSDDEIRTVALAVEARVEQARQADLVEKLREAVAGDRRGVAGLDGVLRALSEHRVAQLLISQGFTAPGWRCDGCELRSTLGRRCKRCGEPMVELEDVVEEAVQDALMQSSTVEVCVNADLDVMGRIGALLRY